MMKLFSRRKVLGSISGVALGSFLLPVKNVSAMLNLKAVGISGFTERKGILPRGIVKVKPVYIGVPHTFPLVLPE